MSPLSNMCLKEEKVAGKLHAGRWKTVDGCFGEYHELAGPWYLGPSSDSITCQLDDLWDSLYLPVTWSSSLQPALWIRST